MMKKIFLKLSFLGLFIPTILIAQNTTPTTTHQSQIPLPKPYNEEENAWIKINELIKQAQKENKNIILQVGGNWCIWCLKFNHFVQTTPTLKEIIDENFIYYHLNFSKKNKNKEVFLKYGYDGEKLGYPYFIILDENGEKIHTQESGSLERGKSYDTKKVEKFFKTWIKKK